MQDFLTSDFLVGKNPTLLFKLMLWEVTSAARETTLRNNFFLMLNSFEATAQATLRVQPAAVRLAHARGRCINVFEGVINLRMLHC